MQTNYEKNISGNNGVYVTLLTTHILIFFYIFISILFFFFNHRETQSRVIQFRLCLLVDFYLITLCGLVHVHGFLQMPVTMGVTYANTEPPQLCRISSVFQV